MSFDIHLIPLERPGAAFDVAAVERMLTDHAGGDDPPRLVTGDGGADVYGAPSAHDWLMLNHVDGVAAWQVMWELASAGPYAVMPVGSPVFVTALENVAAVPDEIPAPVLVVADGEELRRAVSSDNGAALPAMEAGSVPDALREFAEARSAHVESLGAAQIVAIMTSWFGLQRARNVEIDEDGDMLLLQWGTYDWGAGPSFQFDVTRQFAFAAGGDDDPEIFQLSLTAHYPTSVEHDRLGRSQRWCHGPQELGTFQRQAMQAEATQRLRHRTPLRTELRFEPVD